MHVRVQRLRPAHARVAMNKNLLLNLTTILLLATGCFVTAKKPNFVVVMTDDQDQLLGSMAAMPSTQGIMAEGGTQFNNFVVCTSLCCPSRAGFFTGLYTHNHNVTANELPAGGHQKFKNNGLDHSYLPTWLQDLGYSTYHIGKWMNSFINKNCPRGWTTFNAIPEIIYWMNKFTFSENCGKLNYSNYGRKNGLHSTDFTRQYALKYIQEAAASDKPFFLQVGAVAPHEDSSTGDGSCRPCARHMELFPNATIPKSPNLNSPLPGAPLATSPLMNLTTADYLYQRRLQCLAGVDEMVQAIYDQLERLGLLENTYIIYLSDNGFHIRNHLQGAGKLLPYEEDVRIPMYIRGPGIPKGQVSNYQSFMVDMAPTIMQLAGGEVPHSIDGIPLPIPQVDTSPVIQREAVMSEIWYRPFGTTLAQYPNLVGDPVLVGNYRALRVCTSYDALGSGPPSDSSSFGAGMHCYKYLLWCNGLLQFYDLTRDPSEMKDLASTAPKALLDRLNAVAAVLAVCHGEPCYKPFQFIHPEGGVGGLAESMNSKYDNFYADLEKYQFKNCTQLYYADYESSWVTRMPGYQHFNPLVANFQPPSRQPPSPPPMEDNQPLLYFQFYVNAPISTTVNVINVQSVACPHFEAAIQAALKLSGIGPIRGYPTAYLNGCSDVSEIYPNATNVSYRAYLHLSTTEWAKMQATLASDVFVAAAQLVCGSSLHFVSSPEEQENVVDATKLPSLGASASPKLCKDELLAII